MHRLGIYTAFFSTIALASADRSFIFVNHTVDKLSFDLATVLQLSLNSSKCTNVYLADHSIGVESIFAEFVRVYPYEYTVNRRTYSCNGYLAIVGSEESVVMKLNSVPTLISTTELLIIVDERVDSSAEIFNVTFYGNAQANIVTRDALWKLSENFLRPRKFKKVSKYKDMEHNPDEIANLQGRELQAAAFYNPPFCYLNSTINRTVDGIEGEFFFATDELELDGIETKIFFMLAEKMNFTWTIRKPTNYFRYGRKNGSDWNGGMIGQMIRQEIDIAFTSIWLEHDHYQFTNLTKPWTNLAINFLVPRPKPSTSFWALTRPLSPAVWWSVIGVVVSQSAYVYARAWINPRIPIKYRSFVTTLTELTARLVGISLPRKIQGLEFQFQLWHLTGVLVVTAYSSSLAASLASSRYEPRIDTTRQFIAANLSWGREGPTPKFDNYFGKLDPWAIQFPSRYQHEENEAERHEKIVNGNYAIVGRIVGSMFFPENTIRDEDMKGYRMMRDSVGRFYASFAVQPWLLEPADKVILRLADTGLILYHLRDVIQRRSTTAIHSVLVEDDGPANGRRILQVTPLGAGFTLLAFGLSLSTVVFYYEIKSNDGIGWAHERRRLCLKGFQLPLGPRGVSMGRQLLFVS